MRMLCHHGGDLPVASVDGKHATIGEEADARLGEDQFSLAASA